MRGRSARRVSGGARRSVRRALGSRRRVARRASGRRRACRRASGRRSMKRSSRRKRLKKIYICNDDLTVSYTSAADCSTRGGLYSQYN